jgi:hypothetical protein
LTRSLRDDLLNWDVEKVYLFYEMPLPGSRAQDGVAIGSIIIDFVGSEAIEEVTQTVQTWIQHIENLAITTRAADGEKIDVKDISTKVLS